MGTPGARKCQPHGQMEKVDPYTFLKKKKHLNNKNTELDPKTEDCFFPSLKSF